MKNLKILSSVALVLIVIVAGNILKTHLQARLAFENIDNTDDSFDGDTDENSSNPQLYSAAVSQAIKAPRVKYQVSNATSQFIIFSFDGSKSVEMLNETLDFEQRMDERGKPLRFTYFINAAYFLTKDTAKIYRAPGQEAGASKINFSSTTADIALRVKTFNTALAKGNEIGSHTAGHFDGTNWSYDDWKQEFSSFANLMYKVQENNPSEKITAPTFLDSIKGFRAPFLAVNNNLYKVLSDSHFTYDTSGIGPMDVWPYKDDSGLWRIPLGTIFLGPNRSPVVAMDYNLFSHQTNAKDTVKKGTALWNTYFDEVFTAYTEYFNTNYQGNRAPIVIGEHFSKWNQGVYWEALKTFADSVCGRPQVKCVTYKDLIDYLNSTGVPPVIK